MLRPMLLLLKNEDDEFLDEFNRVIKDPDLAKADNEPGNRQPSEYGVEDIP